ncbi:MliC family protein [Rhodobacteraceae bacterium F11138]|nr:MliC family protein [Rhodobacteraceae bacterium F11138]
MFERLKTLPLVLALLAPAPLVADADGPDFFGVTGVSDDDVLNIRSGPGGSHEKIGQIPFDGDGIRNLGCEGGLSFAEWAEASEAERGAASRRRWCQVRYRGVQGWVAGRYLTEGSAPPADTVAPSFDCAKAQGSAQQAVCADPHLARLDLELARLYGLVVNGPHMTADRLPELKAMQRGWIKGRDDCWKALAGLNDCIAGSYAMRIDALRTGYSDARAADDAGVSAGPFAYVCDTLDVPVSMVSINAEPSILSLRWGDNWITPTGRPAASGAKYGADTAQGVFQFWTKGNEALFLRPGQPEVSCVLDETG